MTQKPKIAFVVTANRLSDGLVLYLGEGLAWVDALDRALKTSDPEERDRRLAWARARELEVCGPYALEIALGPNGEEILSIRERLRALGPGDVLKRLGY